MSEDQYRKIITDEIQRQIIDDFAAIISEEISVKQMVVKGFLWRALREWQKQHEITILETERGDGSTPEERIKQASEILNICLSDMKVLVEDEFQALETGIKRALEHYIIHYSER
ncbi:MAG: hypothetical protein ACFFAE_05655 [Candidatus Hodarchaeota archaeon]